MLIKVNGKITDIDEELLTEKLVVTKRKYTAAHPQLIHSTHAPTRKMVLKNISDLGGKISQTGFEKLGVKRSWVNKNSHLLDRKVNKEGVFYKLTKRAYSILNKAHSNESLNLKYPLEDYLKEDLFLK